MDARIGISSNVLSTCAFSYSHSNNRNSYGSVVRITMTGLFLFLSLSVSAQIDSRLDYLGVNVNSSSLILQDYNLPDGFTFIQGSFFPIHSNDICSGDVIHLYSSSDSSIDYSDTVTLTEKGAKILLPDNFEGGTYQVVIQRDGNTQELGTITLFQDNKMPKPTRVVAHRGWHSKGEGTSQNSRAAIRNAFEAGFYGCETDVHQTTDGYLVVNHDFTIKGVTINTSTYDMVKDKTLSNGEKVPLLAEFFDIMKNEYPQSPTKLVIELKVNENTDTIRLVNSVVNAVKEAELQNRVEYISFCLEACLQIIEIDSSATVSLLTHIDPYKVKRYNLTGIDYDYRAFFSHPTWLSEAEEHGLYINAWTVDDEESILQFNNMGVDFITTNNPGYAQVVYDLYKDMMPLSDIICQIDDGVASFSGTSMLFPEEYTAFVKGNILTYVDLSEIMVSKEMTISSLCNGMQMNTLYNLPVNSPIKGNNIIKNGLAKKLVIADKEPFNVVLPFMAETVSYEREISTDEWDMACMPFSLWSNDSVQYYYPVSVNEDTLLFAPTDYVQAGMPCLFHKNYIGNMRIVCNEPMLIETAKEINSIEGFILKGVMKTPEILCIGDNNYYFSRDKFWVCDADKTIYPFRAYLLADANSYQSFIVKTTDNMLDVREIIGDGTSLSIYDSKGVRHNKLQKGLNIIRWNDGRQKKFLK